MRKIDIFNHILPAGYNARFLKVAANYKDIGKRTRGVPMLADLEGRFRVMDEFGDYAQVLSLPTPPVEVFAADAADLARAGNDGMAELVQKYPDRFPGFVASLPMNDADAAARELHRALDDLGARGFQMFTNVLGKPIVAPELLPLFETMAERDLPIWLHPIRGADSSDYAAEDRSEFEIWWTFGWPYETSVAMARLVFAGYFDRFPNLKIITHHMGAMVPYFEGRVGYGWDQLGARTSDRDLVSFRKSMKKRPIEYFKQFYADTALFGAASATKCGYDFFGIDKVVFASDMPFEPAPGLYARETIKCVEALGLTADQKDQIYRRNAEKLLKLPS
jgi:uncharacterized protein